MLTMRSFAGGGGRLLCACARAAVAAAASFLFCRLPLLFSRVLRMARRLVTRTDVVGFGWC